MHIDIQTSIDMLHWYADHKYYNILYYLNAEFDHITMSTQAVQ